jgi:hypothetical protein
LKVSLTEGREDYMEGKKMMTKNLRKLVVDGVSLKRVLAKVLSKVTLCETMEKS